MTECKCPGPHCDCLLNFITTHLDIGMKRQEEMFLELRKSMEHLQFICNKHRIDRGLPAKSISSKK